MPDLRRDFHLWRPRSQHREETLNHLMGDMLFLCRTACAQKEAEKTDALMETAAHLLRESFADRSFSLGTLARELALTPSGFSSRFGIAHGCTPSAYQSA